MPDPFSQMMMDRTTRLSFNTGSADETARWGEAFGAAIRSGVCISLVGTLGAGKTVLAGAIARGLGVTETVLSPTFVLFEEFDGRLPVVHIDLYRLEYESEIEELGVFDTIGSKKVILAEWGDRSELLFAASDIVVELSVPSSGPDSATRRVLDISCTAPAAKIFGGADAW